MNTAPPAATDDLYLTYSRTGVPTPYEAVYNPRRNRLTTFAQAEAFDDRGRYLAAVQREVDAILDEKACTLPAPTRTSTTSTTGWSRSTSAPR